MGFIDGLAQQVGGAVVGAGMGMVNDSRTKRMSKYQQELQIKGNKQMADYMQQKQLELWEKTGYGAQKEQMKRARLNPALMYGMGGGGGQSSAASGGNGVSQGPVPTGGNEVVQMAGMGIEAGLMEAQRELLKAQAEKLRTETVKTAGVDTDKTIAETKNLGALTENTEAKTALTKLDTEIQGLELKIKNATAQDVIDMVSWAEVQARENLDKTARENYIGKATQNKVIDTIAARLVTAVLENEQIRTQIGLTRQMTITERQKLTTAIGELMIKWDSLNVDQRKASVTESMQLTSEDALNKIWGVIEQAVDGIMKTRGATGGRKK